MTDEDLARDLQAKLTEARETNAKLHRRAQAAESPALRKAARAENEMRLNIAQRLRSEEIATLRGEALDKAWATLLPVVEKKKHYCEPEMLEAMAVLLNAKAAARRVYQQHLSHWGWKP